MTDKKNVTIDVPRPEHQKSYSGCDVLKPTPASNSNQGSSPAGSSSNHGSSSGQSGSSGNKK